MRFRGLVSAESLFWIFHVCTHFDCVFLFGVNYPYCARLKHDCHKKVLFEESDVGPFWDQKREKDISHREIVHSEQRGSPCVFFFSWHGHYCEHYCPLQVKNSVDLITQLLLLGFLGNETTLCMSNTFNWLKAWCMPVHVMIGSPSLGW